MENKPKQTAVDYLFFKMEALRGLFLFEEIDYNTYVDEKKEAFNKAKEIEKQQILQAYTLGHVFHDSNDESAAEFYYKTEYENPNN